VETVVEEKGSWALFWGWVIEPTNGQTQLQKTERINTAHDPAI